MNHPKVVFVRLTRNRAALPEFLEPKPSDNTAFVKFPVVTAVEGATGKAKRKRAN